jgi:hypothetical protein
LQTELVMHIDAAHECLVGLQHPGTWDFCLRARQFVSTYDPVQLNVRPDASIYTALLSHHRSARNLGTCVCSVTSNVPRSMLLGRFLGAFFFFFPFPSCQR